MKCRVVRVYACYIFLTTGSFKLKLFLEFVRNNISGFFIHNTGNRSIDVTFYNQCLTPDFNVFSL